MRTRFVPIVAATALLAAGLSVAPLTGSGAATARMSGIAADTAQDRTRDTAPGTDAATRSPGELRADVAASGPSARALGLRTIRSPRSLTGYAFDRCVTPSSSAMDSWRAASPFSAVGIYISGAGRACPQSAQPYLSPKWIARQHKRGWQFLPIHVGRQAPCFQAGDPTPTKPRMSVRTGKAHRQGARAAKASVRRARHFGLGKGSTLYLDIEYYERSNDRCNRAVLAHVDGWTKRVHRLDYRSGLYSSASAAIQAVDVARHRDASRYAWPDQLWFAWGNGKANVRGGPYLSDRFWQNGRRLHQYRLDVRASYGGVAMDIDRNWVSLGKSPRPSRQRGTCGGRLSFASYPVLERGDDGPRVHAARCLLRRHDWTTSAVRSTFTRQTVRALERMQRATGLPVDGRLTHRSWVVLLSTGGSSLAKVGSDRPMVWRLQRALRASGGKVPLTGVFGRSTAGAVAAYERRTGLAANGVADGAVWKRLARGAVGR